LDFEKIVRAALGEYRRGKSNNGISPVERRRAEAARREEQGEDRQGLHSNSIPTHPNNRDLYVPSKARVRRMAHRKMLPANRVFSKGCGPGSSRSPTLGTIKAIAAKETYCIVVDDLPASRSKIPNRPQRATTRRGSLTSGTQIES
jgi:hypothetical protein